MIFQSAVALLRALQLCCRSAIFQSEDWFSIFGQFDAEKAAAKILRILVIFQETVMETLLDCILVWCFNTYLHLYRVCFFHDWRSYTSQHPEATAAGSWVLPKSGGPSRWVWKKNTGSSFLQARMSMTFDEGWVAILRWMTFDEYDISWHIKGLTATYMPLWCLVVVANVPKMLHKLLQYCLWRPEVKIAWKVPDFHPVKSKSISISAEWQQLKDLCWMAAAQDGWTEIPTGESWKPKSHQVFTARSESAAECQSGSNPGDLLAAMKSGRSFQKIFCRSSWSCQKELEKTDEKGKPLENVQWYFQYMWFCQDHLEDRIVDVFHDLRITQVTHRQCKCLSTIQPVNIQKGECG